MQGMEERDSLLGALVHIKDLIANDSQLFALYGGFQGPPPCCYQNVFGLHRTQTISMGGVQGLVPCGYQNNLGLCRMQSTSSLRA